MLVGKKVLNAYTCLDHSKKVMAYLKRYVDAHAEKYKNKAKEEWGLECDWCSKPLVGEYFLFYFEDHSHCSCDSGCRKGSGC